MTGTDQRDCPSLEALEKFCLDHDPGRVADHVRSCPRCRELVGDLRRNAEMLARLATLEPPDGDGRG